jgi:hypothetical protein
MGFKVGNHMPKAPRTSMEIEAEREKILNEALNIIAEFGYV